MSLSFESDTVLLAIVRVNQKIYDIFIVCRFYFLHKSALGNLPATDTKNESVRFEHNCVFLPRQKNIVTEKYCSLQQKL